MEEKYYSRKRRRKQKRILAFLFILFVLGCEGLVVLKRNPELLDTEKVEDAIRDTVLQVPEEVQELRDREVPEGSSEYFEYYFTQLTDGEKRIYRELLEGLQKREKEIYVSSSVTEEISKAYRAVILDHSELFWIHSYLEAFQTVYPVSDYCVFTPEYMYTDEEVQEIQAALDTAWHEVNQLFGEEAGDYEKVQAVYTYLIDEVEYVDSEHDQNIAGALWKKECVCAGYTRAAQYLLNRMEIPCMFVSGDGIQENVSHSWNIVEIDGANYYMDATNGDQTRFLEGDATKMESHKTTMYDYLCPIPEEYESMFQADSEFEIPVCENTEKNFYIMNQGIFDLYDKEQLYDYCCMRLNNGAAVVRYKFSNQAEFEKMCAEWGEGNAVQDVAQYYLKMYNLQSVEYHIGLLEEFYTMYIMF